MRYSNIKELFQHFITEKHMVIKKEFPIIYVMYKLLKADDHKPLYQKLHYTIVLREICTKSP